MKIVMIVIFFWTSSVHAVGNFIGIPFGKPFPSGTYLVDLPYFVSSPSRPGVSSTNIAFNSTSVTYVPTSKVFKGTPVFGFSVSEAFIRNRARHAWVGNLLNPSVGGGLQWALTSHFGFANIFSLYTPMNTQGQSINGWIFAERSSITYFAPDAQGTAHFFYAFVGPSQTATKPNHPDYLQLDFTYVRLFNKLSLGPIAYGSWDTTLANPQSQFAVGGIVGYHFRDFSLQFWLAKDTNQNKFGNYAMAGFLRILFVLDAQSKSAERSFSSLY